MPCTPGSHLLFFFEVIFIRIQTLNTQSEVNVHKKFFLLSRTPQESLIFFQSVGCVSNDKLLVSLPIFKSIMVKLIMKKNYCILNENNYKNMVIIKQTLIRHHTTLLSSGKWITMKMLKQGSKY